MGKMNGSTSGTNSAEKVDRLPSIETSRHRATVKHSFFEGCSLWIGTQL